MKGKQRVLLFAKGFPPTDGGVESYSWELARALKELTIRPIVITQFVGKVGPQLHRGIPVINLGPGNQALVFIKMLTWAVRMRRTRQFAWLYATTWRVAIPGMIAFPRKPIGITAHGREVVVPSGLLKLLMKVVLGRATQVFAVSRYTRDVMRDRKVISPQTGVVNWNGLSGDAANWHIRSTSSDDNTQLFTICRLVPRKNVRGAIEAIALLRRQNRLGNCRYIIAGRGEDETALRNLVAQHNLEDVIQLVGYRTDEEVTAYFQSADVFLHPQIILKDGADFEGFGLVVAEAMSYGIPVIAGRDGGTADFVQNGQNGILVDGHAIPEIADAIEQLVQSPKRRNQLGSSGRHWVSENLSWSKHAKKILVGLSSA